MPNPGLFSKAKCQEKISFLDPIFKGLGGQSHPVDRRMIVSQCRLDPAVPKDGHHVPKAGAAGDSPTKRQPSIEQGKYMGDRARKWGAFAVLFFARETEAGETNIQRVGLAFDVVKAVKGI
jgi:hypothetical protein